MLTAVEGGRREDDEGRQDEALEDQNLGVPRVGVVEVVGRAHHAPHHVEVVQLQQAAR